MIQFEFPHVRTFLQQVNVSLLDAVTLWLKTRESFLSSSSKFSESSLFIMLSNLLSFALPTKTFLNLLTGGVKDATTMTYE